MGQPSIRTVITHDAGSIVVAYAAGDREFSSTKSKYNATTLKLLSTQQSASCCGFYQSASATKNPDGTFDVRVHVEKGSQGGGVAYDDRNPDVRTDHDLVVADVALLPWIYHETHAHEIGRLVLNPIGIESVTIAEAPPQTPPPKEWPADRALQVTLPNQPPMFLWYDPCTFAVDSSGWITPWPSKP